MEFPDVMEEESGCSFYCDRRVHRNEVHSFGDSIYDRHDGIMSGGPPEFDHKIDTEGIPLCVRNGERLKLANWRVSPRFSPEAEIAGTYILANCKEAKLQAGIKPTALCSAIDKENSIESSSDFATLYIQLLSWLCTLSPTVLMPVSGLLHYML